MSGLVVQFALGMCTAAHNRARSALEAIGWGSSAHLVASFHKDICQVGTGLMRVRVLHSQVVFTVLELLLHHHCHI